MRLPPTAGSAGVNHSLFIQCCLLLREPVEQVVVFVVVIRPTQTLSDGLRRDVDLKVDVRVIDVTNDLVAGRHLNLRRQHRT